MDMDVVFLGTGGSVPTARRSTACLLVRVGGDRLLFDCGEGSQRQMQRSTGLVQVDEIYITHLHADHYSGSRACSRPTTSTTASGRCGSSARRA